MLSIRARQFAALRNAVTERFVDDTARRLRNDLPAQFGVLSPEQQRLRIRAGLDRARAFGVDTERDVFRFIALSFAFGESFARQPWAKRALDAAAVTHPADQVAVLWEAAPPVGARCT